MFDFPAKKNTPRSPLLSEAMHRHGVDPADVRRDLLGLANDRCLKCQDADACFSWLTGGRESDAYRWFCPNAALFDSLPKAKAA